MSKEKPKPRDLTETLVIECDAFILKVVTTRRKLRTPIVNEMTYNLPDQDVMKGQFISGHEDIMTADHTITIQPSGSSAVAFTCDHEQLSALIDALTKARGLQQLF